jgi:hypothetical protein
MNSRNKLRGVGGILAAALTITGLSLAPAAYAADPITPGNPAQTLETTDTNSACVQQVEAAQQQGQAGLSVADCTSTITTQSSAASVVTASSLAKAQTAMSASDYASLAAAAATSTVHSKTYSQTIADAYDQVEQQGRFYYNGSRVWISTYDGYTGTHVCIVDYSIEPLGTATISDCLQSGSTTNRTLQIYWNVTLGPIKGVGINWNESQTMHVLDSGAIDY